MNTLTLIAIVVEVVISNVCPSGSDLATAEAAINVPPPERFSMMNGCFSRCSSFWPSTRDSQSVEPPAGNGTTMVTGRVG